MSVRRFIFHGERVRCHQAIIMFLALVCAARRGRQNNVREEDVDVFALTAPGSNAVCAACYIAFLSCRGRAIAISLLTR